MRTRLVTVLISVFLLTAAALYVILSSAREPAYRGRKLSAWLKDYNFAPTSERRIQAEDALRHIGTNALPFLLDWIDFKDVGLMTHPRRVYNNLRMTIGRGPSWENRRKELAFQAAHAIASLGPTAESAISRLTHLLNADGDRSFLAANALAHLGSIGLSPLLETLASTNNEAAAARFHAVGATRFLGTNAPSAVPLLLSCLRGKDPSGLDFAEAAAYSLGELRIEPDKVVPALATCVNGSNSKSQLEAITALGKFGTNATEAVPSLLVALSDSRPAVRKAATNALANIIPRALELQYITNASVSNSPPNR